MPNKEKFSDFFDTDSYSQHVVITGGVKDIHAYKQDVIKNFYRISEFYNFIKHPYNAPITYRNFILVPYPYNRKSIFQ